MTAITPDGMRPVDWCNMMVPQVQPFGAAPTLYEDADWQAWASTVVQFAGIQAFTPPAPQTYSVDDFEQWARDFNLAVRL